MAATALPLRAADGTELACWDFGGDGTALLMVHGTSLHGRCWAPVATALPDGFWPLGLDIRGHGASAPSADGGYAWERFASDILRAVDGLGLEAVELLGVGHSAGAASLLMAEAMRPGTFNRLWAWEPIMSVPGSDLREGRSGQLAARARKRRSQFASLDEAREYLQGRGMFAEFSPEGLEAYLSGAFTDDGHGGLQLACSPEVEARVYETAPEHRAWEALASVRCPVRLLRGEQSPAVPPAHLEAMAGRLPRCETAVWPGNGHFGPFQHPREVAADIVAWASAAPPGAAA